MSPVIIFHLFEISESEVKWNKSDWCYERAREEIPDIVKSNHTSLYDTQVLKKDYIIMTVHQRKQKKIYIYRFHFTRMLNLVLI